MAEHRQLSTTLDSYELEEVEAPLGEHNAIVRATQITIHGKNIFMRALEPLVHVGDVEVLYPRIQPDEQSIVGYLTTTPPEGALIQLEYRGERPIQLDEPFSMTRVKARS
jgi:hypothetical protein